MRREAWELASARRLKDREAIDDIFDRQIELRQQVASNAGFADYRGYAFKAMQRFDYGIADSERRPQLPRSLVARRGRRIGGSCRC